MAAPASFPLSFRGVTIYTPDRILFVAGHDKADAAGRNVSIYLRWVGSGWENRELPIAAIGICVLHRPVPISVMMGVDGSVITCSKEGFLPESVDRSEKGPQHVGDLREVRTIGKKAYVVGMGRTAYRRDGTDRWVRIDQSVRYSSKTSNAGFNSIHGFSEKEIYAVGWEGEIWRYDGEKWTRCPSPAKRALFRVVCAPDGVVYAAGQSGTLVAGRKGKWTVIRQNCTKDDFYGGTWFRDRLYLSTDSGLFVLEGSSLKAAAITSAGKQKLKFRDDESFEHLASTDEVMWSVGSKMAMYTRDGSTWTETGYR